MIKIYTPERWRSVFGQWPTLVIEDDGLIYSEEEYLKLLRKPIGQVDFSKGLIYGSDYLKLSRRPIGAIKTDGDVTKIYGDDYHKLSAWPILYIKENRVYSSEEYFNLFPAESAYIKGDFPNQNQKGQTSSQPAQAEAPAAEQNSGIGFFGAIKNIFLLAVGVVVLIAVMILMAVGVFSGNILEETETLAAFIAVACGAGLALIIAKDIGQSIMTTGITAGVIIYVIDIGTSFVEDGFNFETFLEIVFGPIVLFLVFAIPAAIVGSIVWGIKSVLIKIFKKKQDG